MKLFFTALAVMMTSVAFAQNITVTGNVKDSSTGEFVPFASISVKGTMTGASTDADGHYTLSGLHQMQSSYSTLSVLQRLKKL